MTIDSKALLHTLDYTLQFYLSIASGITSVLTLSVAVAAWIWIPKWRNFKNFIFTNIVVTFIASFLLDFAINDLARRTFKTDNAYDHFGFGSLVLLDFSSFFVSVYCCWLLMISLLFYSDLVVVYKKETTRKYLKSSLLAWGVPAMLTASKITAKCVIYVNYPSKTDFLLKYTEYVGMNEFLVDNVLLCALLLVNFTSFVSVMYSLLQNYYVQTHAVNFRRNIQVAILTFIMSGAIMFSEFGSCLISCIWLQMNTNGDIYTLYYCALCKWTIFIYECQIIFVNVFFLALRSNRKLLWKFYLKKLGKKVVHDSIYTIKHRL